MNEDQADVLIDHLENISNTLNEIATHLDGVVTELYKLQSMHRNVKVVGKVITQEDF